jgi:hypothetical protein
LRVVPGDTRAAHASAAAAWLVAAGFAALMLVASARSGLVFDCHLLFPYGDAILRYLTGTGPWPLGLMRLDFEAYGSLGGLGAALTGALFHDRLGIMDALHGHHAFVVLTGAALVGVSGRLAADLAGARVGVLAALVLATMPRFVAEAAGNASDVPAALAWTACLACVVRGVLEARLAPFAVAALAAAALGAIRTPSLPFLPLVPLLWLVLDPAARAGAARVLRAARWWQLAGIVGLGLFGLVLFRPLAWFEPAVVLRTTLDRFIAPPFWISKGVVSVFYRGEVTEGPPAYHVVMLAITTPLPVLAAALAGIAVAWRRWPSAARLATAWLVVAVGRYAVLGLGNYDGIRHVIDALPALALLAGIGADAALAALPPRPTLRAAVLAVLLLPGVLAVWRLHPYPVAYYNALAGGLHGAAGRFETDYSGAAYREALAWAATELRPEDVLWTVRPYDRAFVNVEAAYLGLTGLRTWSGTPAGLEVPPGGRVFTAYLFRPGPVERAPAGIAPETLPLVHEVGREGVPFLRIREIPAARVRELLAQPSAARPPS